MSATYDPEYAFPMVDEELLNREPDGEDNPLFVLEHILACREAGEDNWEEWHDDYIDRLLLGFLTGTIDSELGLFKGKGTDGDRARWNQYHEKLDMLFYSYEAEQPYDGLKKEEILEQKKVREKERQEEILKLKKMKKDKDDKSLLYVESIIRPIEVEGIYSALAKQFNKKVDTISGIFEKRGALPPKRSSAEHRKNFVPPKKS